MTEQGVIAVTYHAGTGYVELIQPTDPSGAIGKFMAKRGQACTTSPTASPTSRARSLG